MKKHWFQVISLLVLLTLGLVGSYFYFSNFSKRVPISQTSAPRGFSR